MGTTLMESTAVPSLSVIFRGNANDVTADVFASDRVHEAATQALALPAFGDALSAAAKRRRGAIPRLQVTFGGQEVRRLDTFEQHVAEDDANFSVHVSERKITNVNIHSLRTLGYALNDSSAGMAFSTWRRKGLKRRSESVRTEHLMTEAICSWMDVAALNRPFVTKKRAVNSKRIDHKRRVEYEARVKSRMTDGGIAVAVLHCTGAIMIKQECTYICESDVDVGPQIR